MYYTVNPKEMETIGVVNMQELFLERYDEKPHCLVFVLGQSGSGKDTIVDLACELGDYRKVRSYTTRPPRDNEGDTHIFITEEEYDVLEPLMIAKTEFDGYRYGATQEQLNDSDFYILDADGYNSLDFSALTYPYITVFVQADEETCRRRMKQRGDTAEQVERRMCKDNSLVSYPIQYDFRLINTDDRDPVEGALNLINLMRIAMHIRMHTLLQLHDCVESLVY